MCFRICTTLLLIFITPTIHANYYSSKTSNKPIISEVLYNGAFVILNDHSIWEIAPEDRPISSAWITPSAILISKSQNGNYSYTLKNELTKSSIKANKISRKELEEKKQQLETEQLKTEQLKAEQLKIEHQKSQKNKRTKK